MPDLLLDVRGLETQFKTSDGIVHAVSGVSFGLKEGETLDMTGESGCGRNAAMLSVLGLIPDSPGKVTVGKALF
jgi:ABC-type dipeptide/oligopeptide/nickel transport system ATPase component